MTKNLYKIIISFVLLFAFSVNNNIYGQGCMESESEDGVTVVGYLQPQYQYIQSETGDENYFSFNRARLGVVGNIPYDFSYYAIIDFSNFKTDAGLLLDGFITYKRFKNLKMSLGQFKSPVSLEQNTPCQALHTIERSKVVNELAGPDRDIGFMIFGGDDSTLFKYSLAITNDYKRNVKDENNQKSIKGRVVVQPLDFLKFGGSFSYGITGPLEDNTKTRYGAELQLKFSNFLVQAEYLMADDTGDYTTGGGCDGTPIEFHTGGVSRSGYFVQAMYMTSFNFQPVIKFESYDADTSIDDNNITTITFGANYFVNDWTRIQLNYMYKAEAPIEVRNDVIALQLQVKF
ncbi:MAG: hypothetical protein JXR51_04435 [Bacteroidales bacterium]|nr:hypothetical protein [Bacteroidales bacterium]MBN2756404.1 hypothetical protein [Bacteroidales bacterium]